MTVQGAVDTQSLSSRVSWHPLRKYGINLTHIVPIEKKKSMHITQPSPGTKPKRNDSHGSLYWEH